EVLVDAVPEEQALEVRVLFAVDDDRARVPDVRAARAPAQLRRRDWRTARLGRDVPVADQKRIGIVDIRAGRAADGGESGEHESANPESVAHDATSSFVLAEATETRLYQP